MTLDISFCFFFSSFFLLHFSSSSSSSFCFGLHDLRFDVDRDADVVFNRQRRDTVSLWELNSGFQALSTQVASLQAETSTTVQAASTQLQQTVSTAVSTQTAALNGFVSSQMAALNMKVSSADLSTIIANLDVSGLRAQVSERASQSDLQSLSSAVAAVTTSVASVAQVAAAAAAKADLDTLKQRVDNLQTANAGSNGTIPQISKACTEELFGTMRFNKAKNAIEFCLDKDMGWVSQLVNLFLFP